MKIILSVLKATSRFVRGPQIGYQNRARVLKNFRSRHRPYLTFSRSLPPYRLQLYFLFFFSGWFSNNSFLFLDLWSFSSDFSDLVETRFTQGRVGKVAEATEG